MLPIILVQCAQPGLLYVNGAFCGELSAPQMLPVRPDGRVYVEFRPLAGAAFPLATALDFVGGVLQPTLPRCVYAVQWPDQIIDVELRPLLLPTAPAQHTTVDTLRAGSLTLTHQRTRQGDSLCLDDTPIVDLPEGLHSLRAHPLTKGVLVTAERQDLAWAWLLTPDIDGTLTLADTLVAQQLTWEPDGTLQAVIPQQDTVGHVLTARYGPDMVRFVPQERRLGFIPGAPRWPQTPLDTFRAYLDAVRLGAQEEAAAFVVPAVHQPNPLPTFDAVVPLPRPLAHPPENAPLALGLLHLAAENLGQVQAICAHAMPMQHAQGAYLLDQLAPMPISAN